MVALCRTLSFSHLPQSLVSAHHPATWIDKQNSGQRVRVSLFAPCNKLFFIALFISRFFRVTEL